MKYENHEKEVMNFVRAVAEVDLLPLAGEYFALF